MGRHLKGRAIFAAIALLLVIDVTGWVLVFRKGPVASSYVSAPAVSEPLTGGPSIAPPVSGTESSQAAAVVGLDRPQGRPLAVTLIGDSLERGRYASSSGRRYGVLMQNALKAQGATAFHGIAAPAGEASTDVTVPSGQDLVFVEIGTDALSRTRLAEFTGQYTSLVAAARRASPKAVLVCAGTWSTLGAYYDSVIQSACEFAGGHYVPLQPLYDDPANRGPSGVTGSYGTSDDAAPNDAGHQAIAGALLNAVGAQLP